MDAKQKSQFFAEFMLATVTLFWGATFPIVKDAINEMPVMAFLWVRFAMAAILLACIAGRSGFATLDRRGWRLGIFLGTLLFASYAFQTYGLERTSSANAGFLTGLGVVWVPLMAGPILKKPAAFGSKIGVCLAFAGLFMLTWHTPWTVNFGDLLVVICSVFVALHIIGLDAFTRGYDGRALTFVQIATMAVLGLCGSLLFEPTSWPQTWTNSLIFAFIITAVFATAYAFWAMTTFQNRTTPTRAALIYTLEPVFAAIFSVWLAGDRLSLLGWFGGALIVAGMIVAEIWPLLNQGKVEVRA
ncbi:MAG: DMT family transporter [Gammaproteobacteria bacterium]|nr:DMT family transporter [Gammaproteobacteria bacterium]NIR53085.1 DMT family transporter [candidate division KSB1 bacterium]NIV69343.1 EamA family transporter [Phycisphaerae bacterium]NIQ11689.1 DMT family transporter [Gammaproteobacteria bacterium]NIU29060.1 DMT family transporter [candidate division KSB1 bacterium]